MVKRSKLLLAFDAHKGRDYDAEKQKKMVKSAEKRKKEKKTKAGGDAVSENEEQDKDGEQADDEQVKTNGSEGKQDKKGGEGAADENEKKDANEKDNGAEEETGGEEEDEEEEEEEEEEDIPLSDLSENDQDVIPHQRLTINNSAAINTSLKRISFITAQTPFSEHNSLVSKEPIDVPDPNDDLNRELAFYKVCQAAAVTARGLLKKEGIPFTRPGDYFAEMVKSDEHMDKIKKNLYDEAAAKKASAEARRQRDLKKFGKQVQVAKLQQRQKDKRETLDKINTLKKKRKADTSGPTEDTGDLFDVAVDDANTPSSGKRSRSGNEAGGPSKKRQKKDQKFGFGGRKRNSKSGDAMSSSDLKGFSAKKMKAGGNKSSRPGKSKRKAQA